MTRFPARILALAGRTAALAALFVSLNPLGAQEAPTIRALTEPWPEIVKVGDIEIVHVRKNIYMLVGGGAHVTAAIGDEGVFLVDSGGIGQGDKIVAAVRHLTNKRLRFLANTSPDADHAGGNAEIVKAAGGVAGLNGANGGPQGRPNFGILSFAHENTVNRLISGAPDFPGLKGEAVPDSTFVGARKDYYANGEAVQLFFEPHAHTDGDVIVFFRGSDVISAGEIFRTDSYPVIDVARGGSYQGELDALNMILDLAVPERNQMGGTRVVPAHGRVSNEADVLEYRDMLAIIRNRVRAMVDKGMTLDQVKQARPTLEYDGIYGKKQVAGDKLIEIAYNELSKPDDATRK